MLKICLEEDVCLYRPNAREEESLSSQRLSKDTAGEL